MQPSSEFYYIYRLYVQFYFILFFGPREREREREREGLVGALPGVELMTLRWCGSFEAGRYTTETTRCSNLKDYQFRMGFI